MGVLDEMTKGVVERKAAKSGPKLTPVGTEASPLKPSQVGIPEVPEVFLTNEAVADIAKDLREQAAILVRVAEGLENLTATVRVESSDPLAEQKAKERAADEKHAIPLTPQAQKLTENIAAIKAKAEAPKPAAPVADGWSCPTHGVTDIKELTSRAGRAYRACGQCDQFEKPSKSRETQ